jgi:hypothetical protein
MRTPTALNRTLLALIGLLLLAGGGGLLAVGLLPAGTLPVAATTPLLPAEPVLADWTPYAAIGGAVVVGLLALGWLAAQLPRRPDHRPWRSTGAAGTTELRPATLADAAAEDVADLPGVERARATLSGAADHPRLHLVVDTSPDADPATVRGRITEHALPRLRQALELDALPTDLLLRLPSGPGTRVVR